MDPVFALSLQGTLTDIGALAGLAAIPGVAVLALLYFAQAREVKRLREWAGRAPERAAELQSRAVQQATAARAAPVAPARRVVPQPVPGPGTQGQVPPAPQTPAGSTPGNAGGQPPAGAPRPVTSAATAAPPPARAAGVGTKASPSAPAAVPRPGDSPAASAAGASPTNAPPRPVGARATGQPTSPDDGARSPEMAGGAATKAPPLPPTGARPAVRPAAAPLRTSAPSATMPSQQQPRGRGLGGRMGRRGAAIVSVAILVLVVAGVLILTQSGSSGTKSASNAGTSVGTPPPAGATQPKNPSGSPAQVSRGATTVSVLNGTTTPGLAANISDQLQRGGFKRGSVTNAADQQRPETLVNYAQGFKRPAEEIAQLLKLKTPQPIDPGTQAIAGPAAQVVVTVGTDRTQ